MRNEERNQIKQSLRAYLEQDIDDRLNRFLDIYHQWVVGNHYFARICMEAIELFRDGYFFGTRALAKETARSMIHFALLKIFKQEKTDLVEGLDLLQEKQVITGRVHKEIKYLLFTDFTPVKGAEKNTDRHKEAKKDLIRLSLLESEIFSYKKTNKGLVPDYPELWTEIAANGTVSTFLGN